ncbi:membrane-associated metal-dependent phosphohydrolase, HDc domain-containing [Citrifermentans bemidjiense Bem]|uniref:Membrane-associated metal-dependent phosphohydrolase, HDc domain-containing n=1 Tax=Citrifermentans bemidjiense (strain ATCC BAA-1014 / DSM 16622 / JCM 12645 / Bem) TaxID=404380 RepID=B5EGF3_CITBB|nr:HDIG domain-containing metalloprotein [Citrifermentans bemidjiense]ACH38018.1 membrane-associated metal-dependent phosphohydrolase, HDc domain-containing [Citrifermentans bemidjiense Bem]
MPTESGDKKQKSSLIRLCDSWLEAVAQGFSCDKYEKRSRFIMLFLTALFLTLLIIPSPQFLTVNYREGDIATSDIRATQDYLIEDLLLTEKKRAEAEAVAPFIYSLAQNGNIDLVRRFEEALELMRDSGQGEARRNAIAGVLGVDISTQEFGALSRIRQERAFLSDLGRQLAPVYRHRIVADRSNFAADLRHGIVVLDETTRQEVAGGDYSSSIDLPAARRAFRGVYLTQGASAHDLEILKGVAQRMIAPNLSFDRNLTDDKKSEARAAVRPVLFKMKRGEMIVRVGERVTSEQAMKLEKIYKAKNRAPVLTGLGIFGLVVVLCYVPFRFGRKNIRKFSPSNKDILLLSLLTVGNFAVLKLVSAVSTAMGGLFPSIDTASYFYVFPFAASAIIVRIILNSEVALVYCAVTAPLTGIMLNNSLLVVIYALLGGIVGAHGVRQCKERGTIYSAGFKVSVVNMALAVCFYVYSDSHFSLQTVYCVAFALLGGLINAVFASGTIPLIEALFQYTTDVKLLELANLNSPLLRELMIRAPGTYHHSVLVGNMVEAGAEAINANPLLARVAAYYHDVGKLKKPQYFIENIRDGENRHDKLSPSMSALILISHMKEGVELAKEHRVGQPIIEIIRQSHGTSLISYFYLKAKGLETPGAPPVEERDFRYPGPKPQTREAGLVLLADCVEAASRTLTDPTPARIQGMVQKIINNIFIDGQLDECELTLKNLHEIAKSFNQILAGIYHQRIDYPEPAYKEKNIVKKCPEDCDSEPPKADPGRDDGVAKGGAEDLRRLGMS